LLETTGSGKFGTPWERMHLANLKRSAATVLRFGGPPAEAPAPATAPAPGVVVVEPIRATPFVEPPPQAAATTAMTDRVTASPALDKRPCRPTMFLRGELRIASCLLLTGSRHAPE
jgi:hypothetical protein